MRDLNKVILTGRLGRDVEHKVTPGGTSVATFTVACNRPVKQADGNWQDQTEWFRCVAWEKLADRCAEQLYKGRHVYLEGRLQTREWNDPEGHKHSTTELIVTDMITLEGRKHEEALVAAGNVSSNNGVEEIDEGEIPF